MGLKSEYAIRLYQWLKRWQFVRFVRRKTVSIQQLRLELGATEVDRDDNIIREKDELVKLFAQHGFSDGLIKDRRRIKKRVNRRGHLQLTGHHGPKSCVKAQVNSQNQLFDPQYYATLSALDPLSRTGYLQEEYACYFAPRRYDQLLRESEVIEDVIKVLECEAALPLTALIGPNIIIGRSFDSPEATIAMNFVRAT